MGKFDSLKTIIIGIRVATFLFKTSRLLPTIELCQECLILLKNAALEKEVQFLYTNLYSRMTLAYCFLNDLTSGIECAKNLLESVRRLGSRDTECTFTSYLAKMCQLQSKYEESIDLYKKSLSIAIDAGDRKKEALCYRSLGNVYHSLGEYGKVEEFQKKKAITKEIGDKYGEAACCENLGNVYEFLGEYGKAEEFQKKALAIRKEIGDKYGEATCYGKLGNVYQSLGEYGKAEEFQKIALAITKEIGDKYGEAACYGNLGKVYRSLGEYGKAEEFQKKALVIMKEIGSKRGKAACYENLENVYESLGEYGKAEEYQTKALAIGKEIGDKNGELICYLFLGYMYQSFGKHREAKKHHEKAFAMSREIGDLDSEAACHLHLDAFPGNERLTHEKLSNLHAATEKCNKMQSLIRGNDQSKISFTNMYSSFFLVLSARLCGSGYAEEALCVLELVRARALADLISGLHSAQLQTSLSPPSWAYIERIVRKESNCSCLYISYYSQLMFLWVLKGNKPVHFRKVDVNECFATKGLEREVHEVFIEESFREFNVLPEEQCEDRSLSALKANDLTRKPAGGKSSEVYRPVEEEEEENLQPLPTRGERYRMIIAPVADFLDQPEIIIVPDCALYKVPFAALQDESGNYLSEEHRIRIVPSLTTLGLIQDSPTDYYSRIQALIVGEPDVRDVSYKGSLGVLCRLPSAREEAEMIGELIGAEPLLGRQATKEAVLQRIPSVSRIHFAAHGDAERGEIALAPQYPINGTPTEEDYLLTMNDISQVQLRAKLVVLSCCHSAQGHVKAEGVVGIARAFLGSGARSVLVALWAIPDKATKELMSRFYEHLVRGESASESLHQAMRWMRNNGYSDVRDWAPFMLIGDNVKFDFGK